MTPQTHPIDKEQVMAYLDGELPPEQASRVAIHLEQCAECRELAGELRALSSRLLEWQIAPAPARIGEALKTAAERPVRPWRKDSRQLFAFPGTLRSWLLSNRWIWVCACGVVAVAILIKLFSPASHSTTFQTPFPVATRLVGGGGSGGARNAKLADNLVNKQQLESLPSSEPTSGSLIARTASLRISVKDFNAARVAMDRVVSAHQGYVSQLNTSTEQGSPQSLTAKLAIPAAQCDAVLADLKAIGHVEQEQQGGEEVTSQVVDLDTRLNNARETESRLSDILRTRTGKIGDVLEVEREMARVRREIEGMETEQKQLRDRVTFVSIDLSVTEEYQAQLGDGNSSAGRRIRNAVVDGYHSASDGLLSVFLFFLSVGPSLLIWALILFWPARWAWHRWQKSRANGAAGI